MKISKAYLKQIIKEETEKALLQRLFDDFIDKIKSLKTDTIPDEYVKDITPSGEKYIHSEPVKQAFIYRRSADELEKQNKTNEAKQAKEKYNLIIQQIVNDIKTDIDDSTLEASVKEEIKQNIETKAKEELFFDIKTIPYSALKRASKDIGSISINERK